MNFLFGFQVESTLSISSCHGANAPSIYLYLSYVGGVSEVSSASSSGGSSRRRKCCRAASGCTETGIPLLASCVDMVSGGVLLW